MCQILWWVSGLAGQLQQWPWGSVLSREFCSPVGFLPAGLEPLKIPSLDRMVAYAILHNPSPTNESQMQPCEHEGFSYEVSCRMKPWQHLSPQSTNDLTLPTTKHFQLPSGGCCHVPFLLFYERSLGTTPHHPLRQRFPYSYDQTEAWFKDHGNTKQAADKELVNMDLRDSISFPEK